MYLHFAMCEREMEFEREFAALNERLEEDN